MFGVLIINKEVWETRSAPAAHQKLIGYCFHADGGEQQLPVLGFVWIQAPGMADLEDILGALVSGVKHCRFS